MGEHRLCSGTGSLVGSGQPQTERGFWMGSEGQLACVLGSREEN